MLRSVRARQVASNQLQPDYFDGFESPQGDLAEADLKLTDELWQSEMSGSW